MRASADAETFEPLDGEQTRALHGKNIVRVPTIEPIMNEDWFLEQIARCEAARLGAGGVACVGPMQTRALSVALLSHPPPLPPPPSSSKNEYSKVKLGRISSDHFCSPSKYL